MTCNIRGMEHDDLQIDRQPLSLRVMVEAKIRNAIVTGRFRQGQRLVERELCESLGVGRTSVREALRQLEADGLIETFPHKGPVVRSISVDEARDLYNVRELLESEAAKRFAQFHSDPEFLVLRHAADGFAAAVEDGKADELLVAKAKFYEALLGGCRSNLINEMLGKMLGRISLLRSTSMSQAGRLTNSVAEINDIVEAIRVRDAGKAHSSAAQHVRNAAAVALAVLSSTRNSEGRG